MNVPITEAAILFVIFVVFVASVILSLRKEKSQ